MVGAIGNRQFAKGQKAIDNGAIEFTIFCSNKDLDGSVLEGISFDE
jgi:hypothetical protein